MSLLDRRHLPNALTVLRLILAAGFFAALGAFRYPDQHVGWGNVALVVFIVAVLTDALDGYLARRWEAVSTFGRIMDPFCDKVLVLGAFIYLAAPALVDPETGIPATAVESWMVVVILARELLVTGIRGVVESRGVSFASRWSGKWKMILQSVGIPIILALVVNFHPDERPLVAWTISILVYVIVIVTVWSGIPYVRDLPKALRRNAE